MTPLEFRSVRKKLRMSQETAGNLGGISWATVLRYEQGYLSGKLRTDTERGLRRAYDAMLSKFPETEKDFTDWSRLHEQPKYGKETREKKEMPEFRGHDKRWLDRQVLTTLRVKSVGVVSRQHEALFVVSMAEVVDLCRIVIEMTGGKLG